MTGPWNDGFVRTLREHVPQLPANGELSPTVNLYDLGLDSMHSVALLAALEDAMDLEIPDDLLTADTFRTPGDLWALVQSIEADHGTGSPE
jgi:acyl carrier protein